MTPADGAPGESKWTLFTHHTHVVLAISADQGATVQQIAATVGVTGRTAQSIISDLINDGYLIRTRVGRRSHYQIAEDQPLRHPANHGHRLDDLLTALGGVHH